MFDMMFGAPGETRDSIARTIDFLRDVAPGRVGLSCGVRVYPNTPLAAMVRRDGPVETNPCLHGVVQGNDDLLRPIFYVDTAIGEDINVYVASLVRGDERFLHADPSETDGNYNYNDNSVLAQAIRAGSAWRVLGHPAPPGRARRREISTRRQSGLGWSTPFRSVSSGAAKLMRKWVLRSLNTLPGMMSTLLAMAFSTKASPFAARGLREDVERAAGLDDVESLSQTFVDDVAFDAVVGVLFGDVGFEGLDGGFLRERRGAYEGVLLQGVHSAG